MALFSIFNLCFKSVFRSKAYNVHVGVSLFFHFTYSRHFNRNFGAHFQAVVHRYTKVQAALDDKLFTSKNACGIPQRMDTPVIHLNHRQATLGIDMNSKIYSSTCNQE